MMGYVSKKRENIMRKGDKAFLLFFATYPKIYTFPLESEKKTRTYSGRHKAFAFV